MRNTTRTLALLASLAGLVALALTWWEPSSTGPGYSFSAGHVGLAGSGLVRATYVWATVACLVGALSLLALRLAARSWFHEPRVWRRDMLAVAALFAVAGALAFAWPIDAPFWGTRVLNETTGEALQGRPGSGWFAALGAGLLAMLAALRAPPDEAGST